MHAYVCIPAEQPQVVVRTSSKDMRLSDSHLHGNSSFQVTPCYRGTTRRNKPPCQLLAVASTNNAYRYGWVPLMARNVGGLASPALVRCWAGCPPHAMEIRTTDLSIHHCSNDTSMLQHVELAHCPGDLLYFLLRSC